LFGGSAEYVALWFKSVGQEAAFFWYVTIICGVALLVAIWMPDPRRHGYLRDGAATAGRSQALPVSG
jgi:MHS family alpha-ketoglutarate permease-like MFS transporter